MISSSLGFCNSASDDWLIKLKTPAGGGLRFVTEDLSRVYTESFDWNAHRDEWHRVTIEISGQEVMVQVDGQIDRQLNFSDNMVNAVDHGHFWFYSLSGGNTPVHLAWDEFEMNAGHMPRAVGAFKKLGLNPVPAPTDYMSKKNYLAIDYLPSPLHLKYSDLAVHEYLGILWYRLTNRL